MEGEEEEGEGRRRGGGAGGLTGEDAEQEQVLSVGDDSWRPVRRSQKSKRSHAVNTFSDASKHTQTQTHTHAHLVPAGCGRVWKTPSKLEECQ